MNPNGNSNDTNEAETTPQADNLSQEQPQQVVESPQPQTTQTPETLENESPSHTVSSSPEPKSNHKKLWIILGVILALLLIGGAAAFFLQDKDDPKTTTKQAVVVTKKVDTSSPKITTTFTYLANPKELGDLKWFTNLADQFGYECVDGETSNCSKQSVVASDISYQQIGTTKDGKAVVVASLDRGMESFGYIAIETSANTYSILGKLSGMDNSDKSKASVAQLQKYLASNVTIDTTTLPEEFNFPSEITLNKTKVIQGFEGIGPGGYYITSLTAIRGGFYKDVSTSAITPINNDANRTYYSITVTDDPLYQLKEVYGAVSSYYAKSYKVDSGLTGEQPAAITWSDGSKNTSNYMSRNPGCGSAYGYIVAKGLTDNELIAVGKTSDGTIVYKVSDDNKLLLKEYNEDYAKGENLEQANLKNLSVADFQKIHGLIIVKNGFGENAVYLRNDLFFGGGCAKPVIYLYPTQMQQVNVAVGADVKKSEPFYPSGGWRNVFALPNGSLIYQGKGYESLFWEGLGFGEYPIVRAGTVVESSKAVITIKQQLHEQGFNDKETADFLAYWQPKLPNTPYVRLTWLNTDQMNNLAPLAVSPKPLTVIRTFLQFNGLQEPIDIPAQHFSAPERKGFTLVEWGGLLVQN